MATIKSFTDLPQSKTLAEILPLESADMYYTLEDFVDEDTGDIFSVEKVSLGHPSNKEIGCWSLAALLGVLPMITKGEDTANPFISKTPDDEYYIVYATITEEIYNSSTHDNPVDACVAMIELLHEQKLL